MWCRVVGSKTKGYYCKLKYGRRTQRALVINNRSLLLNDNAQSTCGPILGNGQDYQLCFVDCVVLCCGCRKILTLTLTYLDIDQWIILLILFNGN